MKRIFSISPLAVLHIASCQPICGSRKRGSLRNIAGSRKNRILICTALNHHVFKTRSPTEIWTLKFPPSAGSIRAYIRRAACLSRTVGLIQQCGEEESLGKLILIKPARVCFPRVKFYLIKNIGALGNVIKIFKKMGL
jgi:hypothetical protein